MVNKICLLATLFLNNCVKKINCLELEKLNRQQECISIVIETPIYADKFLSNGINPYSNKKCNCVEKDRWWRNYIDEISVGDTIIKKKGELIFSIHKKDTIISHYWKCEGKNYK